MTRRRRKKAEAGKTLWFDMASMAIEASQVIPLRLMKIAAGGPAGRREARRMVQEKVVATGRATEALMRGASVGTVVRQIRRRVRANRQRLSQ